MTSELRTSDQNSGRDPNSGHGHVYKRPDGVKARCGGPPMCSECARDMATLQAIYKPQAPLITSNQRNTGTCATCFQSRSAAADRDASERENERLRALLREWLAGCPAPPEWHWSFNLNIRTVNTLGGSVHETSGDDARDAARYRWLRAQHWTDSEYVVTRVAYLSPGMQIYSAESLDALIDGASGADKSPALNEDEPTSDRIGPTDPSMSEHPLKDLIGAGLAKDSHTFNVRLIFAGLGDAQKVYQWAQSYLQSPEEPSEVTHKTACSYWKHDSVEAACNCGANANHNRPVPGGWCHTCSSYTCSVQNGKGDGQ